MVVCAGALICSLVSAFVTDGSTKKVLSLVMGAFMVCCLALPIYNAIRGFSLDMQSQSFQSGVSTQDEAYSRAVLSQTKQNLELALGDLLLQNGIQINKTEIVLSESEENRIIISSVSIYISNQYSAYTDMIVSTVRDNFGISPNIYTE